MTALEALRDAHARTIEEAPVSITIHRVEYTDDGAGGRMKTERDLPVFLGRVVPAHTQPYISVNEAGIFQTFDWRLLAPWNADIQTGDTFSVGGRTFRVIRPFQRKIGGEVFAVQADIEEVE